MTNLSSEDGGGKSPLTHSGAPTTNHHSELDPVCGERAPLSEIDLRTPQAPTEDQLRAGEDPPRFSALQHPNFRLFWTGNLASLVGTMAQQTAQGWLTRSLTPNEFFISAVSAAGTTPILLLTLYAGVVADRVDKRRALITTNAAACVIALILMTLVGLNVIQIWHIALLAAVSGTITAFDIPIRQSFNLELVGRRDLPNAIALNSSAFNGARVVGPMIGGLLISTVGMAGCFLVDALSYAPLIRNLRRLDLAKKSAGEAALSEKGEQGKAAASEGSDATAGPSSAAGDIREGFAFVRRHPILWTTTILIGWVSLFAMPYGPLLPVFARDVFLTDERGFSALVTCNGLGALGSAVALAAAGKMRHKGKRLLLGAVLFCLSVIGFGLSPTLPLACFFLILAGWFLLTFLMTANTLVQTLAPDDLRGRVFSIYSLALIGTAPLGALELGAMARMVGPRAAVQVGGAIGAAFVLWIFLRYRDLWKEK